MNYDPDSGKTYATWEDAVSALQPEVEHGAIESLDGGDAFLRNAEGGILMAWPLGRQWAKKR